MAKDAARRDSLEGMLADLLRRIELMERHTHNDWGGAAPSTNHGNAARIGSDGLLYTNQHVSQAGPPGAPDFAAEFIPYGSIWVEQGPSPPPPVPQPPGPP